VRGTLGAVQLAGQPSRHALTLWCGAMVVPAAVYAVLTLVAVAAIRCDVSVDPQRFCVWWAHSWLPTVVGVPGVLAFGCYASFATGSRRPVALAAILLVITCAGLRAAAAPAPY
jgi:hypothetical protein